MTDRVPDIQKRWTGTCENITRTQAMVDVDYLLARIAELTAFIAEGCGNYTLEGLEAWKHRAETILQPGESVRGAGEGR